MKRLVLIAVVCAVAAVAGDEKPKPTGKTKPAAGAMVAPRPAPEARELRDFVGVWNTAETYEKIEGMMPGGEGTSVETITLGPGGYSVVMHIRSVTSPMGPFRAVGILVWSVEDKEYKFAWVDSMTPGLTVERGHKEGNDIVLKGEMSMGGKTYKTRDVLSDRTPTSYTLTSYTDDGSGEKKMMTIKATKEAKLTQEKATK
jgi:hypothetical protein